MGNVFRQFPFLTAILDRQGLHQTSEQRRLKVFRHSWGFWYSRKNPKIVMSPTATKNHKQREVLWQQYHLCLAVAEFQIIGGKHFLLLGPESGKFWKLKSRRSTTANRTLLRGRNPKWIFHNFGNLFTTLDSIPTSCVRVVPTEWQIRTILGACLSKVISSGALQYRQHALISDCLDLAHLSLRKEAGLATNWIKDPPEGLKTTKPCTGFRDRPGVAQFPRNFDCSRPVRH